MKARKGEELIKDATGKVIAKLREKDFKHNWRDEIEYKIANLERQDFGAL